MFYGGSLGGVMYVKTKTLPMPYWPKQRHMAESVYRGYAYFLGEISDYSVH